VPRIATRARGDADDGESMYCVLKQHALPAWRDAARRADIICATIAISASFFNTQRVLNEFVVRAYPGGG
jgi:hypothetical protein